ncbi:MAG: SMC-Scp complex subunit ScpB [Ferruginibacter sp.]|nr:SMC-Scp complex subunit ScpB [Ferruginibacter sp.]
MELSQIIPHIEALIFASDKPLTNLDLVELLNNAMGFIDDRATLDQVESAVEGIHEKYGAEFYAFELKQSGGGWQFLTKKEYHTTVAQLNGDKFLKRLSNAALETLSIIAYKQPVTKSEIESIRGVNCDYAVQKLLEKDLVIIAGRNEDAVGKPLIYSTSKSFMDYFGINSADDLPKINEVLMEELVQATPVNNNGQNKNETDESTGNAVAAVPEYDEIVEDNNPGLNNDNTDETLAEIVQEMQIAETMEELEEINEDKLVPEVIEEEIVEDHQELNEDKPEQSAEDKQLKDVEQKSES